MRPVTECDTRLRAARIDVHKFQSTHSITERDQVMTQWFKKRNKFQSTHSITECDPATRRIIQRQREHFNPRTPLQSATFDLAYVLSPWAISIHALHYRVRLVVKVLLLTGLTVFQSTHSITECDLILLCSCNYGAISIHALHYRVRPKLTIIVHTRPKISIHALHYRVRRPSKLLS